MLISTQPSLYDQTSRNNFTPYISEDRMLWQKYLLVYSARSCVISVLNLPKTAFITSTFKPKHPPPPPPLPVRWAMPGHVPHRRSRIKRRTAPRDATAHPGTHIVYTSGVSISPPTSSQHAPPPHHWRGDQTEAAGDIQLGRHRQGWPHHPWGPEGGLWNGRL